MKVSTFLRYGLRALAELVEVYPDNTMSVKEIAARQNISIKYLEQILTPLRNAGIVKGIAGAKGGYKLCCDPSEVSIKQVYKILEGPVLVIDCTHNGLCDREHVCPTRDLWRELVESIDSVLLNKNLSDLKIKRNELVNQLPLL